MKINRSSSILKRVLCCITYAFVIKLEFEIKSIRNFNFVFIDTRALDARGLSSGHVGVFGESDFISFTQSIR